jgi:hypothetical protein
MAGKTPKRSPSSHRLRVFLCHASDDKPAARNLYRRLKDDGFDPWLDEEDLLPGQDWDLEISGAVRHSDMIIVCLSQAAMIKRGYVQKEIKQALDVADEQPEGTIFIIPLKLEECEAPERLRRWQWVNLFEAGGYDRLKRALLYTSKQKQMESDKRTQSVLENLLINKGSMTKEKARRLARQWADKIKRSGGKE